jgi:hypothetical protein
LKEKRYVDGLLFTVSATRLTDGELLILLSTNISNQDIFNLYGRRWEIETLFGALKSKGFNFEDTKIVHQERISNLRECPLFS